MLLKWINYKRWFSRQLWWRAVTWCCIFTAKPVSKCMSELSASASVASAPATASGHTAGIRHFQVNRLPRDTGKRRTQNCSRAWPCAFCCFWARTLSVQWPPGNWRAPEGRAPETPLGLQQSPAPSLAPASPGLRQHRPGFLRSALRHARTRAHAHCSHAVGTRLSCKHVETAGT